MAQNLVADRELDRLIAEKIFKLPDYLISLNGTFYKGHAVRGIQDYSTNIDDAWDVVRKLKEKCWSVRIEADYSGVTTVEFYRYLPFGVNSAGDLFQSVTIDNQVALAICLAALQTVGD